MPDPDQPVDRPLSDGRTGNVAVDGTAVEIRLLSQGGRSALVDVARLDSSELNEHLAGLINSVSAERRRILLIGTGSSYSAVAVVAARLRAAGFDALDVHAGRVGPERVLAVTNVADLHHRAGRSCARDARRCRGGRSGVSHLPTHDRRPVRPWLSVWVGPVHVIVDRRFRHRHRRATRGRRHRVHARPQ